MAPVSSNSCWQIIGIEVAVRFNMNRDAFVRESALPNAPFLSLIRLSSVPLQRDSGLNSMLPSFSTAATSSSTDCTSSSMKPTICMAFWEGKRQNERKGDAAQTRQNKTPTKLCSKLCTKWLFLCTLKKE